MTVLRIQTLDWVMLRTKELFKLNRNRSMLPIWRKFRKHPSLSFIGDYPLMSTIIRMGKELRIKFSHFQIYNLARQSQEFKGLTKAEKMQWVREFGDIT